MFLARSRARRQRFQQSKSLSLNKTLDEQDQPVPAVTAKRGTFKHFAQSLARFQSLRDRRFTNIKDAYPTGAPPLGTLSQQRSLPPFRIHSSFSRDEKEKEAVTVFGYPAIYFRLGVLVATVIVTLVILLTFPSTSRVNNLSRRTSKEGHWRAPQADILQKYGSEKCTIDKKDADELTEEIFESEYRLKKPLIVMFDNEASDWSEPEMWTKPSLLGNHGDVDVRVGPADDIVTFGGNGNHVMTFKSFIDSFVDTAESVNEPMYMYDREFTSASGLSEYLHFPEVLKIQPDHDVITSVGGPLSGVAFHHYGDAWSGVLHGATRWFLYPQDRTPPGGAGYTVLQWLNLIYLHLEEPDRPLECVLDAGEILYIPEGMYRQSLSLADTVIVTMESQLRHSPEERLVNQARSNQERLAEREVDGRMVERLLQDNVRIFQELLLMMPDNAEVQLRLGDAYRKVGDLGDAERHTRHATFMDPRFVMAFINLAQIHQQLGNGAEAERNFHVALRLNPAAWEVHLHYGEYLLSNNRAAEAAHTFTQGVSIRPEKKVLWERLKTSLLATGQTEAAKEAETKLRYLQGG